MTDIRFNPEVEKGLVSVLIPVYNRIDYIAETLESVYQQTYKQFEIIVVDDGSTDGSYEYLVGQEKAGKIQLYTHENRINKGQSAALNIALRKAKGEYISILDSDDLFEVTKLEVQVEFMNNNSDFGLVYGQGTAIDSTGQKLYDIVSKFENEPNDPNEVLLDPYFLLPQNSLVRKHCYIQVGGFNENYRAAQDHDMLVRICEKTQIAKLNNKIFRYRVHENSISSKGLVTRWKNGFQILEAARSRFPYKRSTIRRRKAVVFYNMYVITPVTIEKLSLFRKLIYLFLAAAHDPIRAFKELQQRTNNLFKG